MVLTRTLSTSFWRRHRREDRGAVAVVVAIVLVGVILPLMALVVDVGLTRMVSQQSRGGADAGALAAAGLLPHPQSLAEAELPNGAVEAAKAMVEANVPAPDIGWDAAWQQCGDDNHLAMVSTVYATGTCISFDFMKKRVRVTVPNRPLPTIFSGLLEANSLVARATSTGTWGTNPPPTCGLCVLGTYEGATGTVAVSGDGVAVGGTLAVSGSSGKLMVTPPTPGTVTYAGDPVPSTGTINPDPVKDLAPEDPFAAGLPTLRTMPVNGPSIYGQRSLVAPTGACPPGIYQDISTCTAFTPNGTYFVTGTPGTATQVSLKASGQMLLFFTCSANGPSGVEAHDCAAGSQPPPRFTGTATGKVFTLTAPTTGPGLALVFDKDLRNPLGQGMVGGGTLNIVGDVYGPDAVLTNTGTNTTTVTGHIVMGSVNFASAKPTLIVVAPPPVPKPVPDGPVRLAPTT